MGLNPSWISYFSRQKVRTMISERKSDLWSYHFTFRCTRYCTVHYFLYQEPAPSNNYTQSPHSIHYYDAFTMNRQWVMSNESINQKRTSTLNTHHSLRFSQRPSSVLSCSNKQRFEYNCTVLYPIKHLHLITNHDASESRRSPTLNREKAQTQCRCY